MRFIVLTLTVLVFLAASLPQKASASGDTDPLFADHETLSVRIRAPFEKIMDERPEDKDHEVDGTLFYRAADGLEQAFDVKILTRGNNRRKTEVCRFPPLRLNFKKGDLKDTLFAKQDKLKLVTHCRNRHALYRQTVVREYLAYRILNTLTDHSFQARLLNITYEYSDKENHEEESYAFLIESKKRLGKRLEMEEQDIPYLEIEQLDREYTNLTSIFEYLIGNVDFSPVLGASGRSCCHNFSVFSADGETFWSIPYDFDLTGLVDPPHAVPNPKYGQRNMRQRIYRGRCYNNAYLPSTFQKFRDKRAEIEALVTAQPELTKSHRKSLLAYIESFYKALEKEDKLIKQFEKDCID